MKKKTEIVINKEVRALLMQAARTAALQAYCPYSKYPVGAALLTLDGQIYTGCNIENAAYGLSQCAEQTALFKAISAGCRQFAALAIAGGATRLATPCGACRQVLSEFCTAEMPIFMARLKAGRVEVKSLAQLLPYAFKIQ